MQNKFATYTDGNGGRAILLFLLFSVAIYQFVSVGIGPFAMICLSPLVIAAIYVAFRWRTATFWLLFFINYFLQWFNKNGWLPGGNLCFLEWPELIESLLPEDVTKVHITTEADGSRTISF